MLRLPIAIVLMLGALGGCGSAPPAMRPVPAAAPSATQLALGAEQRRLAELFRGTPVVFAMQADGSLRVDVPLRYCFDAGHAAVKPPLAAVLDRIARSQRNQPTLLSVSAPTDPGAKALALATRRAVAAREHMVAHGVAATRFSIVAVARGGVSIVVSDAALP